MFSATPMSSMGPLPEGWEERRDNDVRLHRLKQIVIASCLVWLLSLRPDFNLPADFTTRVERTEYVVLRALRPLRTYSIRNALSLSLVDVTGKRVFCGPCESNNVLGRPAWPTSTAWTERVRKCARSTSVLPGYDVFPSVWSSGTDEKKILGVR